MLHHDDFAVDSGKKRYGLLASFLFLVLFTITPTISSAKLFSKKLCQQPGYTCYKTIKKDSWEKLFPHEEVRSLVMRINRMNTPLYPGLILAIPEDINETNTMVHSPFPLRIDPPGYKVIFINLASHAFGAYNEEGTLVHWGPVSAGKGFCPDVNRRCSTPTGDFYIYAKGGPGCVSSKYPIGEGGAPMSYCMYFYHGYALHASFLPGYHASHGCIRLFDEDAEWLNRRFITLGKNNKTKVMIRRVELFSEDDPYA